jgi:Putative Se/S carrier protein-like
VAFFNLFKRKPAPLAVSEPSGLGAGIMVFASTSEVIKAEKVLKAAGWSIRVMGPPPEIQTGCDLVIEFPLVEKLRVRRTLEKAKVAPLQVVPVNSPLLKPVDLFQVKDFGNYLMVRAANMKLTIDKASRRIVNVSGGGCPDVPYLAQEMVGQTLESAPSPRDIGHTLCGYALQLAYEEMQRQCSP